MQGEEEEEEEGQEFRSLEVRGKLIALKKQSTFHQKFLSYLRSISLYEYHLQLLRNYSHVI